MSRTTPELFTMYVDPETTSEDLKLIEEPDIVIPLPAVYSPAAENCVQVEAQAENAVIIHPCAAYVPSVTRVYEPSLSATSS